MSNWSFQEFFERKLGVVWLMCPSIHPARFPGRRGFLYIFTTAGRKIQIIILYSYPELFYMYHMSARQRTTTEAAKAVRITRATLQDWIKRGKFGAPQTQLRNGHAVRLWTDSDVERLRIKKKEIYNRVGRPKGSTKSK